MAKVLRKPPSYFIGGDAPDREKLKAEIAQDVRKDMAAFVGVKVLPVVGRIAAGLPILAEENIEEYIPVPEEFASSADFLLKVRGDSMVDAGIQDGDYVLIRQTDLAQPGDIVVALVNGDHATLKFLRFHDQRYYLHAANPGYSPIPVTESVRVQGVYVGLFTRRGLAAPTIQPTAANPPVSRERLLEELAREEQLDPDSLADAIEIARLMSKRKGK
jgi:SOS regulatory protein LexA